MLINQESVEAIQRQRLNGDEQNAEDYADLHVTLGTHFPVFVQFEGDQKASC
jgi:hypothetical protein